jgi:hypothetical protein
MSPDIKDLIEYALEGMSEAQGNAGCNDLTIPNTPEMRDLYHEYQLWNDPTCVPGDDQYMPFPKSDEDEVTVGDSFLIFLMQREMGLLT